MLITKNVIAISKHFRQSHCTQPSQQIQINTGKIKSKSQNIFAKVTALAMQPLLVRANQLLQQSLSGWITTGLQLGLMADYKKYKANLKTFSPKSPLSLIIYYKLELIPITTRD
jgi:hypothetical protein